MNQFSDDMNEWKEVWWFYCKAEFNVCVGERGEEWGGERDVTLQRMKIRVWPPPVANVFHALM